MPSHSPARLAQERVLTTYELLEHILLELSCRELFIVQRVSQTWHSVTKRSGPVREKMFLLASGQPIRPIQTSGVGLLLHYHDVLYSKQDIALCPAIPFDMIDNAPGFSVFSVGLGGTVEDNPDRTSSSRDMFISSPPLTAVTLDFLMDVPEYRYRLTIWNREGVKVGEIFDWTWKLGRDFERTTGHRLDGRHAVAAFWVANPVADVDRGEFEEAW